MCGSSYPVQYSGTRYRRIKTGIQFLYNGKPVPKSRTLNQLGVPLDDTVTLVVLESGKCRNPDLDPAAAPKGSVLSIIDEYNKSRPR